MRTILCRSDLASLLQEVIDACHGGVRFNFVSGRSPRFGQGLNRLGILINVRVATQRAQPRILEHLLESEPLVPLSDQWFLNKIHRQIADFVLQPDFVLKLPIACFNLVQELGLFVSIEGH